MSRRPDMRILVVEDEKALCDFLLDGGENARTLGEYLAAKNAP